MEQSQKCVKNTKPFMTERGNPLLEDSRIPHSCQTDRRSFGLWWPCSQRSSIGTIWRTNWKAVTTRQIEQILYWCRIPDYCWSRTVFHDEWHWRILTIHRFSSLSWVRLAKRRRFIWTKRLDSRKHQDRTRIGSYNLLPTRYTWSGNQN